MITAIICVAVVSVHLLGIAFWGLFLRLGLAWAKADSVRWRRVLRATFVTQVVFSFLFSPILMATYRFGDLEWPITFAVYIVWAVANCWFIGRVFHLGQRRAFQAWATAALLQLIPVGAITLLASFFLWEAFEIPTNGMAPTVVGRHLRGKCPVCGQVCYGSPYANRMNQAKSPTICSEFHLHAQRLNGTIFECDRILSIKVVKPSRWDVIVFKAPEDPTQKYLNRLVGMPGETVFVEGGSLWVNGEKMTPPEDLEGLTYRAAEGGPYSPKPCATKEAPVVLAKDEYFVIGDFSQMSRDSRYWTQGAPGYPAYAVPESYIIGVATHIYWPPERWRVLK